MSTSAQCSGASHETDLTAHDEPLDGQSGHYRLIEKLPFVVIALTYKDS